MKSDQEEIASETVWKLLGIGTESEREIFKQSQDLRHSRALGGMRF